MTSPLPDQEEGRLQATGVLAVLLRHGQWSDVRWWQRVSVASDDRSRADVKVSSLLVVGGIEDILRRWHLVLVPSSDGTAAAAARQNKESFFFWRLPPRYVPPVTSQVLATLPLSRVQQTAKPQQSTAMRGDVWMCSEEFVALPSPHGLMRAAGVPCQGSLQETSRKVCCATPTTWIATIVSALSPPHAFKAFLSIGLAKW